MASHATSLPDFDSWAAIHRADTPLVLEPAAPPQGAWVDRLLAGPPFAWRAEGPPEALAGLLPDAPAELRALVDAAAHRFAHRMGCTRLKLRVELVDSNACTKVHADYTDVRLIQTLAGPGTDYAPRGDADAPLARVPTGWTGLFKGALYPARDGKAHAPCLHRSPPIAGSGVRRLLLVLDSAKPADANQPD
jgi:hypothetical protein